MLLECEALSKGLGSTKMERVKYPKNDCEINLVRCLFHKKKVVLRRKREARSAKGQFEEN